MILDTEYNADNDVNQKRLITQAEFSKVNLIDSKY